MNYSALAITEMNDALKRDGIASSKADILALPFPPFNIPATFARRVENIQINNRSFVR